MYASTRLTISQARAGLLGREFTAVQLLAASLHRMKAADGNMAAKTAANRLLSYQKMLAENGVNIKNLSPAIFEVMRYAAAPGYGLDEHSNSRIPAFDGSIFSFNPVKVVGGSDAAVCMRSINGSAINSTQELSTMCYLGADVKTGDAVILSIFISNAYRVDFEAVEEKTGIRVECDEGRNPTDEAKFGAGDYLKAAHGFFNPAVIGQYFARTQEDKTLPALRVLIHDMILKTPTHTGTMVTNAGHNQVNWEIVPRELQMVFERQMGDDLQVVEGIGAAREQCWQVDLSSIYLFGGNPPKVLQALQSEVEQAQAALLNRYTGGRYVGDHWRSNLNTTASNRSVLSMDLRRRGDMLWEKVVRQNILRQSESGVSTIAVADGASNYFVPHIRYLLEDLGLEEFVHVVSYPEELQAHIVAQNMDKVYLLATRDGLKMGEHSIFAQLIDVVEVVTPQDSMKSIPLMVDNPEKAGKKMPCPTGATQQFLDKRDTQDIKISKIEALLQAVKDVGGNVRAEHAALLKDAISWIPDGVDVILGATELELLYLDERLRQVFEKRDLKVISPLMGLVAPAVVSHATKIRQPEVGIYRDEAISDAPQSPAPDHVDMVRFADRLEQEQKSAAPVLSLPDPRAAL